jgi:hypothetical protein
MLSERLVRPYLGGRRLLHDHAPLWATGLDARNTTVRVWARRLLYMSAATLAVVTAGLFAWGFDPASYYIQSPAGDAHTQFLYYAVVSTVTAGFVFPACTLFVGCEANHELRGVGYTQKGTRLWAFAGLGTVHAALIPVLAAMSVPSTLPVSVWVGATACVTGAALTLVVLTYELAYSTVRHAVDTDAMIRCTHPQSGATMYCRDEEEYAWLADYSGEP